MAEQGDDTPQTDSGDSSGSVGFTSDLSPEQQEKYIRIWEKSIDTQMHFNEMSVKSRQLGLTFLAAALGVAVVLMSRGNAFSFPTIPIYGIEVKLHISVVLVLAGLAGLFAVRQLDLNVYHRMLRGAVTFGEDFEHNYMKRIFRLDKGMTEAISWYSRMEDAKAKRGESGKYEYCGSKEVTTETKIRKFYKATSICLVVAAIALFIVTNVPLWVASEEERQSNGDDVSKFGMYHYAERSLSNGT